MKEETRKKIKRTMSDLKFITKDDRPITKDFPELGTFMAITGTLGMTALIAGAAMVSKGNVHDGGVLLSAGSSVAAVLAATETGFLHAYHSGNRGELKSLKQQGTTLNDNNTFSFSSDLDSKHRACAEKAMKYVFEDVLGLETERLGDNDSATYFFETTAEQKTEYFVRSECFVDKKCKVHADITAGKEKDPEIIVQAYVYGILAALRVPGLEVTSTYACDLLTSAQIEYLRSMTKHSWELENLRKFENVFRNQAKEIAQQLLSNSNIMKPVSDKPFTHTIQKYDRHLKRKCYNIKVENGKYEITVTTPENDFVYETTQGEVAIVNGVYCLRNIEFEYDKDFGNGIDLYIAKDAKSKTATYSRTTGENIVVSQKQNFDSEK